MLHSQLASLCSMKVTIKFKKIFGVQFAHAIEVREEESEREGAGNEWLATSLYGLSCQREDGGRELNERELEIIN